jgi:DNA-binding transcriptional MerR regulator
MTAGRVRRILRRQGMPPKEIRTMLRSSDAVVVRRVLELHRERLGEWFDEQQRLVDSIERPLTDAGVEPTMRSWSRTAS